MSIRFFVPFVATALALSAAVSSGCSSDPSLNGANTSNSNAAPPVDVDTVEVVHGVVDNGRDPAVIAIDIGGEALCSGTLIAPKVVLTARHCVSDTSESVSCPAQSAQITGNRDPSTLGIYVGDDISNARFAAKGSALVLPHSSVLCDNDIAVIVLDREVTGVHPISVGKKAPKKGDHVRAVGFGKNSDDGSAGIKLLREHVPILDVGAAEFYVGEATCQGDSGGPALDETTGDLIGVVSRGGPTCDGADVHNVYTRAEVFQSLIDDAIAQAGGSSAPAAGSDDGSASTKKSTSDMGASCRAAADCSTGICAKTATKQYCSRSCGTGDRCPAHYHCTASTPKGGQSVCIAE